ncbi:hypothetical protein VNO78_21122 [Psophocarpus tetragonolobus]|uniref:Uncharacterized protein n=1 Tax=Psophocarpus tetragonolobus TaxID=3891 RepID=A0AAN9XI38_PSOTE
MKSFIPAQVIDLPEKNSDEVVKQCCAIVEMPNGKASTLSNGEGLGLLLLGSVIEERKQKLRFLHCHPKISENSSISWPEFPNKPEYQSKWPQIPVIDLLISTTTSTMQNL